VSPPYETTGGEALAPGAEETADLCGVLSAGNAARRVLVLEPGPDYAFVVRPGELRPRLDIDPPNVTGQGTRSPLNDACRSSRRPDHHHSRGRRLRHSTTRSGEASSGRVAPGRRS